MAVWVDCTATSTYFRGFACDMGVYTGPWPLLPPGEMTGIDNEIDFYVGLPNPADPTDVTIALDGSYDTPVWDAYRYVRGGGSPPTQFGYFGDLIGPTATFPMATTPPAGAHLYVAAYVSGGAPANPPEFYVPASYAAGGAAAFETAMGHWTSDQSSYDTARTVFVSGTVRAGGSSSHTSSGNQDIAAAVATLISGILATSPSGTADLGRVTAIKDPDGTPASTAAVEVSAQADYYDGTSALASGIGGPPLGGLVYGVDYSQAPYIDDGGSAGDTSRLTGSTSWDWGNGTATSGGGPARSYELYYPTLSNPPHDVFPPSETIPLELTTRVTWVPSDITGSLPWTTAGAVLGDFAPLDETPGITPGTPTPLIFDYSPISDLAFSLHWTPTFMYDGSVAGLTDFAMPSSGDIHSFTDIVEFVPGNPQLLIHSGPWQYWVPGAIVPTTPDVKWHTVGGHWATVGGATMRILTPLPGGDVWVDVADGPG